MLPTPRYRDAGRSGAVEKLFLPALDALPLDLRIVFRVDVDAVLEVVAAGAGVGTDGFFMAIDPDLDAAAVHVMEAVDASVNAVNASRTDHAGLENLQRAAVGIVDTQLVDVARAIRFDDLLDGVLVGTGAAVHVTLELMTARGIGVVDLDLGPFIAGIDTKGLDAAAVVVISGRTDLLQRVAGTVGAPAGPDLGAGGQGQTAGQHGCGNDFDGRFVQVHNFIWFSLVRGAAHGHGVVWSLGQDASSHTVGGVGWDDDTTHRYRTYPY